MKVHYVIIFFSKNYDLHLLLKAMTKEFADHVEKIRVTATNMEKYIAIELGAMKFIDSCQFLTASLDSLVKNLTADGLERLVVARRHFPDPRALKLVAKKGVYPYEYMDHPDCMSETALPSIESFYSSLTDSNISPEDYEFARDVWNFFEMKTMGEYHDLYVSVDVLLLADVFERFRDVAMNDYKIDPTHHYTLPGLSWSAMLRQSGCNLQLISDPDMSMFFEDNLRGGVSQVNLNCLIFFIFF